VTSGISLWTSGIQDKNKKFSWCSKKFAATDEPLNWASGQPTDGCLSLTLSNSTVNQSTFALSDCSVAQYFVCEVRRNSGSHFCVLKLKICRNPWLKQRLTSCRKSAKTCSTSRPVCSLALKTLGSPELIVYVVCLSKYKFYFAICCFVSIN
jgi:hypothetical protein